MRNDKFSYVLRIVAGLYLIYLSYSILSEVFKGNTGSHSVPVTIAAVIFIVLGAVIAIWGARGMIQMNKEAQLEAEQEESDETEDSKTENVLEEKTEETKED